MATREEQETTITVGRDDEWVRIWTNNPVHARKLEKDARVTQITANPDGFGGDYLVPASDFNVIAFRRRGKPMSEEQRAAAAERLQKARKK